MRTFFVFDLGETLLDFNKSSLWYQSLRDVALPRMYFELKCHVPLLRNSDIILPEFIELAYNSIAKQNPVEKEWRMERRISEYLNKMKIPVDPVIIDSQMDIFFSTIEPDVTIYSDTLVCLSTLKERGYQLALVSNTPWQLPGRYLDRLLLKFQLLSYFPIRYYSGDLEISKPNPRILELIQAQTRISKDQMIFVGDSVKDIDFASNFGIPGIWIKHSNNSELKTPNKPLFHVKNLTELLNKLPIED